MGVDNGGAGPVAIAIPVLLGWLRSSAASAAVLDDPAR
jgi:hypothetical protein